jgi:dTDP-4-dehydrorhamnose 3,5-epimerase
VNFSPTAVEGVYVVTPELFSDERGFFARTWCADEFSSRGLEAALRQCSVSFTRRKGTLRGLHYQEAPYAEAKLVRCTRGAIFDVAVDLRPKSPTFLRHTNVVLRAGEYSMLYIPEGCAHGLQTLEDDTEVSYQISQVYAPESARGVRWDDPALDIRWPLEPTVMSDRDRDFPDLAIDTAATGHSEATVIN